MRFQGMAGQKECLFGGGQPTGVERAESPAYTGYCLVKQSRALLASNPARDSQARAGRMSRWPWRTAPPGPIFSSSKPQPFFLP